MRMDDDTAPEHRSPREEDPSQDTTTDGAQDRAPDGAPNGAGAPASTAGAGPEGGLSAHEEELIALATTLMDLARQGDTERLVPVLDQGAPLNLRDAAGNTMLMLAAYHGHADLVRALASRGADVDLANDRGQSPLAGAVFKGFTDVVETLVEAGADPDAGTPSARESAQFFGREELSALFG